MIINHNLSAISPDKKTSERKAVALTNLNKKSLLFEIVNRKNPGQPVESFILTIPPESLEVEEPHRVSRVKTWNGTFVDDYGPDNIRIMVAGNTGGTTLRRTVALNAEDTVFDGKAAFFFFRNRIMRYKSVLFNYQDYDMIVYDLSAANDDIINNGLTTISNGLGIDAYIVSLDKFKMSRSKDKPLFYNYSIEMETLRVLGTFSGRSTAPVSVEPPIDWISYFRRGLNSVKSVLTKVTALRDTIESWITLTEEVVDKITDYYEDAIDILTYPLGLVKRLLGATRNIIDELGTVPDATLDAIFKSQADALSIIDLTRQIQAAAASLVVYGKTPESRGVQKVPVSTVYPNQQSMKKIFFGVSDGEAEVRSLVLQQYDAARIDDIIEIYGYVNAIIDAGTTMERLAADYYNDPAMWDVIAAFNGMEDETQLVVGESIKVPILLQGGVPTANYIYTESLTDVYGSDVRIDSAGNIVVSGSGDLATVEGRECLIQNLNIRLQEELGSRLRLNVYGIRAAVGSASVSAPIAYILSNIKDTVAQDPRIRDISNLKIRGEGDILYISFKINTIKINDVVPFSGTI